MMAKLHKITDLSVDNLKGFEEEIKKMSDKMNVAAVRIAKELSEYGLKEMENIYSNFELTGNEPSTFYITGSDTEKKIVMDGPQAIYDEFGTGTEGELNPYPVDTAQFGMKGYNTGETIRPAKQRDVDAAKKQNKDIGLGELFWTYIDSNGEKQYTKGTPAQKEVYDSMKKTLEKSPEVITNIMKEIVFND